MAENIQSRLIRNQVDLILFEEGSFSPLAWLLRAGHLDYSDYRNWKTCEVDYLEDCFKTPVSNILADLALAHDYSRELRLKSSRHSYLSDEGKAIFLSRNPENELVYTTLFEPEDDRIQMDLFFDSSAVCAVNDLIAAILNKRNDDVGQALEKLKYIDIEKFNRYNRLLSYRNKLGKLSKSSKWKIQFLEKQLAPLAFELLGGMAHDFVIPLWREISEGIAGLPFDRLDPKNHLSYSAFKSFQWDNVLLSIRREHNWQRQPILLFRYAEACFKQRKELEGLEKWFVLFIFYPEEAEQEVDKTCNRILLADWHLFQELDPELDTPFFPAWMLIKKHALAKHAFSFDDDCAGTEMFKLLTILISNRDKVPSESAIQLRSELKQKHPALFEHLMKAAEER